jgi:phage protein D
MAAGEFGLRPHVEIDGSPLPAEVEVLLERVVVDDHIHTPDMFTITFRDAERQVLAQAKVKIGSKVKISAPALGGTKAEMLIAGEVTALEAEYDSGGSRAIVRGYDASHRLHRGRETQTYRNVKYSDIAQTIASRHDLQPGTIDDSKATHDHVSQANLSDWDFLASLGGEIGFEVTVSDGKLSFRKPTPSSEAPGQGDFQSSNPLQLVFGQDLIEFRPRVSSAEQVKEVKVRGWDPKAKQVLIGSAPASTSSASVPTNPAFMAEKFGSRTYTLVDRPLSTQSQVDAAAHAGAVQIGSAAAEAEGLARGNPKLKAGQAVSVSVVAADFVGRYTLTHTRHVFDAHGYRTQFTVSGRQNRSLFGLVSAGSNGGGAGGGPPIFGVVVGIVTNNDDPDQLSRVKLKFPWLSDSYESDWARITQLGAGQRGGAVFIPEVNDEVLVAFEFGDVSHPYVVGSLYNGKDKPSVGSSLFSGGKVKRSGFVSRKGHRLLFFDDAGKSGIALISSDNKVRVALKETGPEIHIYCEGKVTIESQGDMKLSSKAGLDIEAGGQMQIKGDGGVKVNSSAVVEVKGQLIKLN